MKKVNKLVLLLIIILGICIVDFVIINDKDSEKAEPEKSEVESVEQVGNNVETEDFSVSFETDGEETAKESNTATSSTSEGIKKITSWDFENEVLNQKGLVVVDFYADWCGPCKQLEPVLESVASQKTDVKFVRFDTDNQKDAGANKVNETYRIMYLPTVILFKDGNEINRSIGFVEEKGLLKLFDV